MNFEERIRALSKRQPSMAIAAAIEMIDIGGRTLAIALEGVDVVGVAEWIMGEEDILVYIPEKKINAIKEVRQRAGIGLKEAKDAVEYVMAHHDKLAAAQLLKAEAAEQEAIASILGRTPRDA